MGAMISPVFSSENLCSPDPHFVTTKKREQNLRYSFGTGFYCFFRMKMKSSMVFLKSSFITVLQVRVAISIHFLRYTHNVWTVYQCISFTVGCIIYYIPILYYIYTYNSNYLFGYIPPTVSHPAMVLHIPKGVYPSRPCQS